MITALSTSLPTEIVSTLVEQGGPTVGAVAVLWWRLNRLEERFAGAIDDLEADVDSNEALIYGRMVESDGAGESPTPRSPERASRYVDDGQRGRSSSD